MEDQFLSNRPENNEPYYTASQITDNNNGNASDANALSNALDKEYTISEALDYIAKETGVVLGRDSLLKKLAQIGFLPGKSQHFRQRRGILSLTKTKLDAIAENICSMEQDQEPNNTQHYASRKQNIATDEVEHAPEEPADLERLMTIDENKVIRFFSSAMPTRQYLNDVVCVFRQYYSSKRGLAGCVEKALETIDSSREYSVLEIIELLCVKQVTITTLIQKGVLKVSSRSGAANQKTHKPAQVFIRGDYVKELCLLIAGKKSVDTSYWEKYTINDNSKAG